MVGFQKATREKLWLRVLLGGPSGSGKTYSGLRLATGLANACGSRIAAIDTENGRMRYYANEFDFDCIQLEAPFKPEKYIEAIDMAVRAGYKVLLIDSTSHEWTWCNETVTAMPGNSFQNWGKIKSQHHQKFTEKIIQSPIHIICTARGKDEYVMDDKDGKKTPRKVGAGIKSEQDTEYEYTVTFNIAQDNHVATAMKDNTHLFEGRYEKLTEADGEALYNWANSGDEPVTKSNPIPEKTEDKNLNERDDILKEITATCKELIDDGFEQEMIYEVIKSVCGVKNYNKVTDINMLKAVLISVMGLSVKGQKGE